MELGILPSEDLPGPATPPFGAQLAPELRLL